MNKHFNGFIPLLVGATIAGCKMGAPVVQKAVKTAKSLAGIKIINQNAKIIFDELKFNFIYKINISNQVHYLEDFLTKYFNHVPDIVETEITNKSEDIKVNIGSISMAISDIQQEFIDHNIIEGIPVRLTLKMGTIHDENSALFKVAYIETLRCNEYPNRLKELLKREIKAGHLKNRHTTMNNIILVSENYNRKSKCIWIDDYVPRNFDNVFIPDEIINAIKSGIDNFRSRVDWYNEHAIPYHYGIMLHGSPGMGKSSLAQAIANHMNSRLYIISGDEISGLPMILDKHINTKLCKNEYNIILIEDIDCGLEFDTLNDRSFSDDNKSKKKAGLASILNAIDGLGAPTNTIYIFTTNHIEKLDPALIRPGRIDLSLEIPSVNKEIFTKFMAHHFPEYAVPKTLKFNDGISCATLQVMAMEGKTPDDLVKFVSSSKTKKAKHILEDSPRLSMDNIPDNMDEIPGEF